MAFNRVKYKGSTNEAPLLGLAKSIYYWFVGKFPKLFNFSDGKEKSYLVELNIFKENAFYGFQKIPLDNFPRNFYI